MCYEADGYDRLRGVCVCVWKVRRGYLILIAEYAKDGKCFSVYLVCTKESLSIGHVPEENHVPSN